ncbi:MAG: methylmalonyl Co-A mutase-associated GTPase MeaB [Schleiferiaceae bacterium]|nr:methylmalonyl Co-A mutase-associated GTPase MeaB [Schleiferiaceae bacterium]
MGSFLNPNLQPEQFRKQEISLDELERQILSRNITALSQAITLIESARKEDREKAATFVSRILPHTGNSIRIGISGIPGVGKSTFIEAFGMFLIEKLGRKVAILAVDPSSQRTGGSILGDKTRMERLAQLDEAYIRPSPSAGSLGGVANKTRQSILLCEAAGFDTILVETVGVGQSETAVKSMTDAFLLLLLPGAGDELQGIKRGIMEMADIIAINKADGDNLRAAKTAAGEVKRALHLYPTQESGWHVPVETCSALSQIGIDTLWERLSSFENHMKIKGYFENNRSLQFRLWFEEELREGILRSTMERADFQKEYQNEKQLIAAQQKNPVEAVLALLKSL